MTATAEACASRNATIWAAWASIYTERYGIIWRMTQLCVVRQDYGKKNHQISGVK